MLIVFFLGTELGQSLCSDLPVMWQMDMFIVLRISNRKVLKIHPEVHIDLAAIIIWSKLQKLMYCKIANFDTHNGFILALFNEGLLQNSETITEFQPIHWFTYFCDQTCVIWRLHKNVCDSKCAQFWHFKCFNSIYVINNWVETKQVVAVFAESEFATFKLPLLSALGICLESLHSIYIHLLLFGRISSHTAGQMRKYEAFFTHLIV